MNFEIMLDTVNEICDTLMDMDEIQFMTIMSMIFDEYHAHNEDSNSAQMARTVADMVEKVNKELGQYERH